MLLCVADTVSIVDCTLSWRISIICLWIWITSYNDHRHCLHFSYTCTTTLSVFFFYLLFAIWSPIATQCGVWTIKKKMEISNNLVNKMYKIIWPHFSWLPNSVRVRSICVFLHMILYWLKSFFVCFVYFKLKVTCTMYFTSKVQCSAKNWRYLTIRWCISWWTEVNFGIANKSNHLFIQV